MKQLTFAAIVPTYNRAHSVGETLDSILSQDRPPEEVIVVDDGSTDGTADVLAGFEDRITVLHQANTGVAAARNAGAALATAQWLTFCDSDDVWCPGRMAVLRSDLAEAGDDIVAHVGDVRFTGHGPAQCWFEFLQTGVVSGELRIEPRPLTVFLHSFSPIAAALRRDVFQALGGFDPQFRTDEDSELGHRFADRGSFLIRGDVLAEARRHEGDTIALSGWRRRDPATAAALKEEQFKRILSRASDPRDRRLAQAALSSCLRQQSALARAGRLNGSPLQLLARSIFSHHNPAKGAVLAAMELAGMRRKRAAPDRT